MKLPDVGKMMYLPISDIQSDYNLEIPNFIKEGAIDLLHELGGRNWVPIIVKQTQKYKYEVIHHEFVYQILLDGGFERAWCVITDDSEDTLRSIKVFSEQEIPKICLNSASEALILECLTYLAQQPATPLSKVDVNSAASIIASADRRYWNDFSIISKLKCGITRGKKLDVLSTVFKFNPLIPPPPPSSVSLKSANQESIEVRLKYLAQESIAGFESLDLERIKKIMTDSKKDQWKSLNPLMKLDSQLKTKQIKALKLVFDI